MSSARPSIIEKYWRQGLVVVLVVSLIVVGFKLHEAQAQITRLQASLMDARAEFQAQELRFGETIQKLTDDLRRQEKDLAEIHRLRGLAVTLQQTQQENGKIRAALTNSNVNKKLADENRLLKDRLKLRAEQTGQPLTHEEFVILHPEQIMTDEKVDAIATKIAAGTSDADLLKEFGMSSKNPDLIRFLQRRAEGRKIDE